jgi:hypothetical protein
MKTNEQPAPTRRELAGQLQLLRAEHSQLKKLIVDFGNRTARFGRQLLELQEAPGVGGRRER